VLPGNVRSVTLRLFKAIVTVPYQKTTGIHVIDKEQKEQQHQSGGLASKPSPSLTRRSFVTGVLGVGAAAIAAGGGVMLNACASPKEQQFEDLVSGNVEDKDIETFNVDPKKVIEATDFDEVPVGDYLKLQATWDIPLGSLVHQIDSSAALVLFPGAWDESLRKIGILDLGTGELTTVIDKPVGMDRNTVIYDARASRAVLIWVEFDLGSHHWSTYVAPLNGTVARTARMVAEGDAEYEPSMLAVAGNKAYWTVMPLAAGAANLEDSYLRAFELGQDGSFGQGEPYTVLTSHGRMITNPLVSEGIVTFVPRVDTGNIYYQLTALNCSDDKVVDFKVLPQSLRVTEALYMGGAFFFSIENNYGEYAGGLSQFGTYQDLGDGSCLRMGRPPLGPLVRFGDCLVVKSIASIVGIDPARRAFFVIDASPRSADFAESLVGWGVQDRIITVSVRLAESGSSMEATVVRVFDKVTRT
jgi:hypothetical protein